MAAQGRRTAFTVVVTALERRALAHLVRRQGTPAGLATRARIVLLRADGVSIAEIGRLVGVSRPHVYKWLRRWRAAGLAGLQDRPGRGGARHRGR